LTRAWIGLGANLGERGAAIARALAALDQTPAIAVAVASSAWRARPWGDPDQPDFINAVAAVDTTLSAHELLARMQSIEQALGRKRSVRRWGPRVIDLDLLLFGRQVIDRPGLVVPHPRLAQRAFVLIPLAELAPSLRVPGQGRVDRLAAALDDSERAAVAPEPALELPFRHQARIDSHG